MELNIDPKKVIAIYGGITETHRRLTRAGYSLSLQAVEKWVERGNIPTARLTQIAACAAKDKHPFDILSLTNSAIRKAKAKTAPKTKTRK
jgi:hypothetical protein